MPVFDCTFCIDTFCDYPGEYYIFCRARSARSDYFETVGPFCSVSAAQSVLREMTENGGMISDYRRIYGG